MTENTNREPFNLAQCIEWIDAALAPEDREKMASYATLDQYCDEVEFGGWFLHFSLGMAVRNNCNLWAAGCDNVVPDINRLLYRGVTIDEIDKLDLNWSTNKDDGETFAASIYHPDNCSGVIVEVYHRYIRGEIKMDQIRR